MNSVLATIEGLLNKYQMLVNKHQANQQMDLARAANDIYRDLANLKYQLLVEKAKNRYK